MSHFENVLKAIERKNFVFISVNTARDQDDYVNPFVKNYIVTFTPLKGTREMLSDYNYYSSSQKCFN
jgi:hypothetical protein